ncbi:MAG: hypothetical protein K2Q06_09860 [Parvularculaceae bacterium]|nr:hypothetical protein [Parvularculaceae bacterium]
MRRLPPVLLTAALASACAPQAAPNKTFPATGETKATLIFNTGEAPAGALDYLGKGLSERGVAVTFASGSAWTSAAARAMTPDACTQIGGFGDAVTEVARFAAANVDKGVDNALLVGGLIDNKENFLRSTVMASTVFAAKDPKTPQTVIDAAWNYYPGYSSYTVMKDASRADLLGPVPAGAAPDGARAQLVDIAEYEIISRCRKRLDRIEQAAQRKAWDEAQEKAKTTTP